MPRFFEHEICNISRMNPDQTNNFNIWFMTIDPTVWIAADYECSIVPVESTQLNTLFKSKPVAVGDNIIKIQYSYY